MGNSDEDERMAGKKNVLIRVVGTQKFSEGETDRLEFVTTGAFYERQGAFYLLYRESEVSGMAGVTTSLRIEGKHITLNRMGKAELKQEFQPGILHRGRYVTSFGTLWLSVLTTELEYDLTVMGGRISLEYDLFADDALVSHNGLEIIIKEEPPR
ncbi:putative beta-barrel protein YwiB [Peptococcaceae bacterium CEB3]|nr:putative beta-barrel protein YwiB [Peptococcaceae bacterium CEB3]